jgi:hypothetical protein
VDRDAIARERRRREAVEALEFEREREAALREQVEETILEEERQRVDREALAQLEPAEAALVREILGTDVDEDGDDEALEEWDEMFADFEQDEEDVADDTGAEDEIGRLNAEIEDSRSRQQALERFVDALGRAGGPEDAPPATSPHTTV